MTVTGLGEHAERGLPAAPVVEHIEVVANAIFDYLEIAVQRELGFPSS